MATIAEALAIAVEHHQAGRLQEAEVLYARIIDADPEHAGARYLMGMLAAQVGRFDVAERCMVATVTLAPDVADRHLHRAMVLEKLGRPAEAASAYRRALALRAGPPHAFFNLGVLLRRLGRAEEAAEAFARAVAGDPAQAAAHLNLGELRLAAGDAAGAAAAFEAAAGADDGHAAVWTGLSTARRRLGDLDGAAAALRRAIPLRPQDEALPATLGVLLQTLRHHREAVNAFHRAVVLAPDWAEVTHAMALSLSIFGGPAPSLPVQRRAAILKPLLEPARLGHAIALHDLCRFGDARGALERLLALNPAQTEALCFLGSALRDLDEHTAATAAARRAVLLAPDSPVTFRAFAAGIVYDPALGVDARFAAHRWLEERCARRHYATIRPHANLPDPGRRIRIGILSSDLRSHPVARNLEPALAGHDRSRFAVFCYADVEVPDAVTARFRALSDGWRSIAGLDDAEVADLVRGDGIDILVCLAGRFDRNRPLVCAHRPAPVQVSFHDVATSGMAVMDYLIADRVLVPPHGKERFTERVIRLPSFYVHAPMDGMPDPGPLPAATAGHLTFGSFNNPGKVNHAVLALWADVLEAVPGSRLILKYNAVFADPALRARVLAPFARRRLDARVTLLTHIHTREEHLALYRGIDVALDPSPFSGSTTTFEALWMGVPVITLPHHAMVSRWTASMLRTVGLPDFIADTREAYIALARRCAADTVWLSGIRSGLRERVRDSAITDAHGKVRHLERAFRAMWRRWCAGRTPAGPLNPGPGPAWLHAGTARLAAGDPAGARAAYGRALVLDPADGEALYALGVAARRQDDAPAAIAANRRAARLRPDDLRPLANLAVLLHAAGRDGAAAAAYRRVLEFTPDRAEAWHALGQSCAVAGGPAPNAPLQRRAVRLDPALDAARLAHAVAVLDLGRPDEAEAAFRRVLALDPAHAESWCMLASVRRVLGRPEEGTALNRRGLRAAPDSPAAQRGLLSALLYDPSLDEAARFAEHRRLAERCAPAARPHANPRDPGRRLRVGYLSSDLCAHPVARNLEPILAAHDRDRFEIVCYADVTRPDSTTGRLRALSDGWRDTAGLDDAQLADLIRADGVDVLVSVAGRFDGNRPLIAAQRAAPVQVSLYDGATSGLTAMDAILTDAVMTPRGGAERFTERPVRLPALFAYQPIADAPDPAAPPMLAYGRVTFGSFNNPSKVNDAVLALWARVLNAVPESRLVLKYKAVYGAAALRRRVLEVMARNGVDAARIVLPAASQERAQHLALYHGVDIGLDPFPFCGATTTFEALYMGVPVVTLPGANMMSRWSASLLRVAGCGDLVAADAEDYVRIAASLAADPGRLTRLHAALRPRLLAAAILDPNRKARQVERVLRVLWRRWCASQG
ncbi:MAG TPA: tetratricopeptide repeat protein [Azospirillum sp.]|nr:tetratricopeptide repeat protein [Azospirillum sp.]